MKKRNLWLTIFALSAIVTLIGLGFTTYNYFVFHQPFMNRTTKGLLSAFFLSVIMVAVSLSNSSDKK
ncbi:hypothetical protein DXB95_04940 [Streptococcus ilei]|uniref:hypothetical protein n=1 Tax=Streptococcus ilei TaxID=1156431 RepID=UPI000E42E60E|nr:hypothetical protein [Streptococcus ilei]RGM74496.1 hypothetical protein DXB95_04940 [Streptococcus ilei]